MLVANNTDSTVHVVRVIAGESRKRKKKHEKIKDSGKFRNSNDLCAKINWQTVACGKNKTFIMQAVIDCFRVKALKYVANQKKKIDSI